MHKAVLMVGSIMSKFSVGFIVSIDTKVKLSTLNDSR